MIAQCGGSTRITAINTAGPTLKSTWLPGRVDGSGILKLSAMAPASTKSAATGARFKSPAATKQLTATALKPASVAVTQRALALRGNPNIKNPANPVVGGGILRTKSDAAVSATLRLRHASAETQPQPSAKAMPDDAASAETMAAQRRRTRILLIDMAALYCVGVTFGGLRRGFLVSYWGIQIKQAAPHAFVGIRQQK